ncbi:aldehyde dehydrogenase family protein [Micromonospora sp. CPCC 205539]|uniref:aldehyde dehydrogenase family protein n=1 Tax=Micromonospora sp. CPCC 205539 TaxID=3122408 RepID=UPI002FF20673
MTTTVTAARESRLPVANPATGQVFDHAPRCTVDALERIVARARSEFRDWSRRTDADRREHLHACGAALSHHVEELAELLAREQGKPLADARAEVGLAADWFRHTAALPLERESLVDEPAAHIAMDRVPYGVVAAIAPSNYPIILAVTKIAPALLAGNTVVLKPSPLTPLSSLRMAEILTGALPPGVLTAVVGDAELGHALVAHPDVALVSFTGSIEVGRAIAGTAAARLAHTVLELGGNDPCIVLPDTDVTAIAEQIFWRAMRNSGQFCAAIKRVYVPEDRRRELVEALSALADRVVVGDGLEAGTELGPLVSRQLADRVAALVEDAGARGATVHHGGAASRGGGYFHRPTIVSDLPAGTELELTEQFGPVLPVISYHELADAVARANSTEYGLGASVWGDPSAARAVADELDCGTVWINDHGDLRHDVPFGGTRSSGLGVEYGYWGLLEYTRIKITSVKG